MSKNLKIVYICLLQSTFTNVVNVETCDMHTFNCAWKKQKHNKVSVSIAIRKQLEAINHL